MHRKVRTFVDLPPPLAVLLRLVVLGAWALSVPAQSDDTFFDFGSTNTNGTAPVARVLTIAMSGLSSAPSFTLAHGTEFRAGAGTCNANFTTCSVQVTFSPNYPGLRQDALLIRNEDGALVSTAFLNGKGIGSQVAIMPGMLSSPTAPQLTFIYIHADSAGHLFVAEHSSVKRIELATNKVITVAGTARTGYSGDGGPATLAQLDSPGGIAVDGAGNVYIADTGNKVVRRVDAVSGIITTFAGNGSCALPTSGVPATQAALCAPTALAVDTGGNLYINVRYGAAVQKVNRASHIITTVAGNGMLGYSGDGGPATAARLGDPQGITLDDDGNLYITAGFYCVVRKVDAVSGIITTVAGNGSCNANTGDGGPATAAGLWGAGAVAVDAAHNLYIATGTTVSYFGLNLIRKVDAATGTISTIAGGGNLLVNGDFSVPATAVRMQSISDVSLDADGTLFIAGNGFWKVSPLSGAINFGSVPVSEASPAQAVSVSNTGNASADISSITLTGQNAGEFSLETSCGTNLTEGNSCILSTSFRPAITGLRLASVTVKEGRAGSSHAIALTGVGAPALAGILKPDQFTFPGHVRIGSRKSATIGLTNPSSVPLPVSNLLITGANASDFSVFRGCEASLGPGMNCTLYLTFVPQNPGTRTAVLQVMDTSGNSLIASMALSGFATALASDLEGDGTSDLVVWRPSDGRWYGAFRNSDTPFIRQWGIAGDIPLTGDFDGDGKTDLVVWRPSDGVWYVLPSSRPGQPILQQWGISGDIPVAADFDGDGMMDFVVWRPSNGVWYVIPSSSPDQPIVQQWGVSGDIPVAGDFDGDGKTDFAVWRPSNGVWYIIPSSRPDQPYGRLWGMPGDIPVPADFFGYGVASPAVWRPSDGTWYAISPFSSQEVVVRQWGAVGDIPLPGDYDGDGKIDFAVWRPSDGTWYILPNNGTGQPIVRQWGIEGDIPL